jgi:hypothetical protein
MHSLARKVLTAEYVALRTPLAVLDNKVVSHLPERSRVRRSVEMGLGVLDGLAERVLSDATGTVRATAATPEQLDGDGFDADQFADAQEQIAEALLSDEEQRRHVGELADADEREVEELADLRAKHRAQELAEERRMKADPTPAATATRAGPAKTPAKSAARKAQAKNTATKSATKVAATKSATDAAAKNAPVNEH